MTTKGDNKMNRTVSTKQKLKELRVGGKLKAAFLTKQSMLHPEIRTSISAFSSKDWFDLIGVSGKFGQMSDSLIDSIYEKAKWLIRCNYIKIFICEKCGKITFYCEEEDLKKDGSKYYGLFISKNTCHTLESNFVGYGSLFDCEKLKIELCERCYIKLKGLKL